MNKYYVLEKLAQRVTAPADSTGVASSKKTPSPEKYTPPDVEKNLRIAKEGFKPTNPNAGAGSYTQGKPTTPPNKSQGDSGKTPQKGNYKPNIPPTAGKGGNTKGSSTNSFSDAFNAYAKKDGAKIGDTFEYGGKKYKFEYADKKKNEEFMKNYEAKQKEAPSKSYDKGTNTLTYNTDVVIKGKGTGDSVQKLPLPSSQELANWRNKDKAVAQGSEIAQKAGVGKPTISIAKGGKMPIDFGI